MIKLDNNLLQQLGLGEMPAADKTKFLKHIYETLEVRVGTRLAATMNEQQMNDFGQFITNNDEQGAFNWLETNFPDYKSVVAEEFGGLKAEISQVAPDILAAGSESAAEQQVPEMPDQPAQ